MLPDRRITVLIFPDYKTYSFANGIAVSRFVVARDLGALSKSRWREKGSTQNPVLRNRAVTERLALCPNINLVIMFFSVSISL